MPLVWLAIPDSQNYNFSYTRTKTDQIYTMIFCHYLSALSGQSFLLFRSFIGLVVRVSWSLDETLQWKC